MDTMARVLCHMPTNWVLVLCNNCQPMCPELDQNLEKNAVSWRKIYLEFFKKSFWLLYLSTPLFNCAFKFASPLVLAIVISLS